MHPSSFERALRRGIYRILAATVPIAAAVACGGAGDGGPADADADVCNSCFCGAPLPPGPTYDVTYTPCSEPDASSSTDASDDAGDASDASEEDAGPPPLCDFNCDEACNTSAYQGGVGECLGETPGDGGTMIAHCQIQYLCGRRLEGLLDARPESRSALAASLAHAAWLEAASIRAFRRLARELRAHGAPRELVEAARKSAREEARHARVMARLARRRGAAVPRVEVEERGVRDLESIARENAVEGCVGETYGALLAVWQSERAADPEARAAMRAIAPDELRHAALAWAVAAWADSRLSDDARERVRRARENAVRDVLQNAHIEPDAEVAHAAGVPRAADAVRLATEMNEIVWSRFSGARETSRTDRRRRRAA